MPSRRALGRPPLSAARGLPLANSAPGHARRWHTPPSCGSTLAHRAGPLAAGVLPPDTSAGFTRQSSPSVTSETVYEITGGDPTRGRITALGAKNFVTKAMVAAPLGDSPTMLTNVPPIGDV